MSTKAPRELEGVTIDVESLFAVSVDFSHLRVTITAILDALRKSNAKTEALERIVVSAQNKVESLEKTVAASQSKIEALDSTVGALGSQVRNLTSQLSTANERLNVAEKLGAEAAQRIVDLEAKDATNTARIAALEKSMATVEGYRIPSTFAAHEARIAALEASDKELRALLALGNDKAEAAARAAAAAAAAAAGKPIPVAVAAPVSNGTGNNDALLQRIKSALEALTTRVAALEARPVSAVATAAPTVTRVPSKSGGGASDLDRDQLAQHARQLAASATEMAQIQAALAELKKLLATKASLAQLDSKADKDALRALEGVVEKLSERVRELEREVAALKDQMAAMQDANRALAAKLQALLEASSCRSCRSARPTVKCAQCNLSLCDACDDKLHGADASPAMQAHLRTPLTPVVAAAVPDPPSHRSAAPVASGDDNLRRWAEEQFGLLNRKEKATRADINDLGNKEKDLRAKLEALLRTQADDKQSFADLGNALKKLEAELRTLINNTGIQGRNYTDSRLDELLAKLREMEKSLDRGLKSELKRFERDVLVFMESHDGSHGGSDAAVGKIHFRCLSCDQTVGNLQGPASLLYARAVGSGTNGSTTIGLNGGGGAGTNMSIERGRELYLNGRDGAVYKGRDPSNVSIALGDPSRPSQFAVSYSNNSMGSTTNARGTPILDQKTVMAPYAQPGERDRAITPQSRGGMMARPQSAPYDDPAGLSARSNASSLPPTRPATRSGLRSRQGGREQAAQETTPNREQLTQQQQQQLTGSF